MSEDHHGVCEAKTQVQNSSMRDGTCEERREYFVISEHTGGVGEIAQLVTCLLCRHEDPSSIPKTHIKMSSACKPRAAEKLRGRILGGCLNSSHICVHAYMQKEYIQNLCGMNGGGESQTNNGETHTRVVCNIYTQCSYKLCKLQEKGRLQFSVLMRLGYTSHDSKLGVHGF